MSQGTSRWSFLKRAGAAGAVAAGAVALSGGVGKPETASAAGPAYTPKRIILIAGAQWTPPVNPYIGLTVTDYANTYPARSLVCWLEQVVVA